MKEKITGSLRPIHGEEITQPRGLDPLNPWATCGLRLAGGVPRVGEVVVPDSQHPERYQIFAITDGS